MPSAPPPPAGDSRPHLRRFARTDIADVLRIERESFPHDPYPERLFLLFERRDPALFLVATVEDRVAGYAVGAVEGPERGRVVSIAVESRVRRRGVGRKLSEELLRRLEAAGARRVELETRVDNAPAIGLWRDLGFRRVRLVPGYYSDGTDALLMERP